MAFFISPKIVFGKGVLKRLGSELGNDGAKVAIITDKTMAQHVGTLKEALQEFGYQVKIWDGAEPEPSLDLAAEGGRFLSEFSPQWVAAFGGGSAIDTAKASWILYERPDIEVGELYKAANPKAKLGLRKKASFMAVPTTSGTGSEATWAVVLTDKKKNRKVAFANNEIVPDIALLVPEFTAGMPKSVTAGTGMDVLGHALDGYTARQQTDFSDGLCLQAIGMCLEWLPKAFQNGDDLEARAKMQNAAAIAGIGFGNSNTSLCHALAHSLGVAFKMPHGRAVGLALTYSLDYIASTAPISGAPNPVERLATVARFVGINETDAQAAIDALLDKIDSLKKEIQEPITLSDAGISEEKFASQLENLVLGAAKDVNMYSSPCECKDDALEHLFRKMFSGR
ncbi:MAG: iron-containing alcohol dehydrogenase [Desulfobacterales bacterium]|nr:iron-containing alcohol dehydrogenase [Desulfobacterales bacterium]